LASEAASFIAGTLPFSRRECWAEVTPLTAALLVGVGGNEDAADAHHGALLSPPPR
jgi:hypothetical protein